MEQVINKLTAIYQLTTQIPLPLAEHDEVRKAFEEIKDYIESLNLTKK